MTRSGIKTFIVKDDKHLLRTTESVIGYQIKRFIYWVELTIKGEI